jgi:tryptophan-rich sensory protein
MTGRSLLVLVVLVIACEGVGIVGAGFTAPAIADWYRSLERPSWTPPDWLFGPVWVALYALMAVAAWLVWRKGRVPGVWTAGVLFGVQLALNAIWTPIFFGLRQPGWALLDILLLWAAILLTLIAFARVRPLAAGLLAPYLAWVTYAGALNFALWRLNPV